jgi:hypothetical protein
LTTISSLEKRPDLLLKEDGFILPFYAKKIYLGQMY